MPKFLFLISCFVLVSCFSRSFEVKPDSEQAIWGKYLVVTSSYGKCYEEPGGKGNITGFARVSEIFEMNERKVMPSLDNPKQFIIWYKLEKGWIAENDVRVCNTKAIAHKTAEELK